MYFHLTGHSYWTGKFYFNEFKSVLCTNNIPKPHGQNLHTCFFKNVVFDGCTLICSFCWRLHGTLSTRFIPPIMNFFFVGGWTREIKVTPPGAQHVSPPIQFATSLSKGTPNLQVFWPRTVIICTKYITFHYFCWKWIDFGLFFCFDCVSRYDKIYCLVFYRLTVLNVYLI